ncbi:hypothetical protein ABZ397_29100 [Streptomyces sp. NPDC005876]|uniref:hypothetical protein n=1 Tax=Streptomyces sp. NPDC005876 TaxID=3157076 RepID=UPI00340F0D58
MTTGSSAHRPNEYAIAASVDLPSAQTTTVTGTHPVGPAPADDIPAGPFPEEELLDEDLPEEEAAADGPASDQRPEPAREDTGEDGRAGTGEETAGTGDPAAELVRTAVADRPLEEVVALITALERSPQYARATVDALRAAGVNRSVEDVTRLIGLLTRPPRHADSADEAIRAAAECRSVEDVSRLMELLRRTSLEPHCGQEAVRAAATGRPVEELVQLIGRLDQERRDHPDRPGDRLERPPADPGDDRGHPAPAAAVRTGQLAGAFRAVGRARGAGERGGDHRPAARRTVSRAASWTSWCAVAVLAGCGVAFFPLRADGTPARDYGVALALSAFCLALALVMTVRPAVPVLAAAVVGPAALAAAKLYAGTAPGSRAAQVMDLTLAPAWGAVPAAVAASLAALTALCVRVAHQAAADRWTGPVAQAGRAAD